MPNNSTSERSPNSPAGWPAESFPPLASLAAAAGLALVTLGATFLLAAAFGVSGHSVRQAQLTLPMAATQTVGYIPILIYLGVVLPKVAQRSLDAILGVPYPRAMVVAVLYAFVMFFVVTGVTAAQTLIFHQMPHQLVIRLVQNTRPGLPLAIMVGDAVVLGPVVEELVFRGFVFNALWRRMPFWPAAACSGLVFGAVHGEPAGILPLAAGGIVLASVYARTGSLWASMVTHGTFNAMTFGVLLAAGVHP